MRRFTILVGLAAAVALMVSAPATAQTTVYDYDMYLAWWDSFDCDEMKVLLPQKTGASPAETASAHTARVCVGSGALNLDDRVILRDFIESTMHDNYESHKMWWDANAGDTAGTTCGIQQALAGRFALANDAGAAALPVVGTTGSTTGTAGDYCGSYDRLRSNAMARAMKSGDALSGRAMMTTDDDDDDAEAPALPLVGVGLLGLLLAGRGAWLRRRA